MAKISPGISKVRDAAKQAAAKAGSAVKNTHGPSPNPMTNLIIADIALRGGGRILRHAVETVVLGAKYSPEKAKRIVKGRTMAQTLVGTALARVATRSVPGAVLIGGGLVVKALLDRRKGARKEQAEGEVEVAKQAQRGR